jgi:heme A synthase
MNTLLTLLGMFSLLSVISLIVWFVWVISAFWREDSSQAGLLRLSCLVTACLTSVIALTVLISAAALT